MLENKAQVSRTPMWDILRYSSSYLKVTGPPHLIPWKWYCSCLGHNRPPTTHHVYHHFCPHKAIFWFLWTDRPPCGCLLEIRPTFSTSPAPPEDSPVQPKGWIVSQNPPIQPPSTSSSPQIPTVHLNNSNNTINTCSRPITNPMFRHPEILLIPLAWYQKYSPPLPNKLNSRNLFLNWNTWIQLKLMTVTPTQTWNVLTPPPTSSHHPTRRDQKTSPYPTQEIHPTINSLDTITNTSTTTTTYISSNTVSPSSLS